MKVFLLVAVVAAVAGWFGGPLVYPTSHAHPASAASRNARRPITTSIGPIAMSAAQLRREAAIIATPIYWAGPAFGDRYEFTRTSNGRVYVRYLPWGVRSGAPGAHFLIVATYPYPSAYNALKKGARGRGIVGPGRRFVWVTPDDPKTVYVAFPGVPSEIEVDDPRAARALAVAESASLNTVG